MARGCLHQGQCEEGLRLVKEVLDMTSKTGVRHYEAETYRLKGELLLNAERGMMNAERQTQQFAEAEACFLKAIEITQSQQAKSWELRAATNLARLWQQQGKRNEARELVGSVYNWFTEGFDTQDLQDARVLLHSLDREEKYY